MSPSLLKFRRCFAVLQFRKYKMHTSCAPLRAPMTTTAFWCCCKSKKVFPCFLGLQMGCAPGILSPWGSRTKANEPPTTAPVPLSSLATQECQAWCRGTVEHWMAVPSLAAWCHTLANRGIYERYYEIDRNI